MGKERVRCFVPEGSQKRKATRVRSLRQRWIVNSVVPIFVLLALIVGGVSLGISNYYYKGMLDGLERQARAQSGAFVDYFMDQGFANYLQRANQAISDYADKERVEMQFLSSVGRIQASSTSNLTVGTRPGTEDISRAVETNRISYFRGADPKTGEQILAVSHPLTVNGKVVGVLRFVTSLRQVNVQVRMTVLAVVLVALLCLLLVLSSNLIFINNVVEPVAVVSDAAKRISQGSYGFTLENKYTGELGELVDNINDMSMKIGQNEKMKTEFISSVSHELAGAKRCWQTGSGIRYSSTEACGSSSTSPGGSRPWWRSCWNFPRWRMAALRCSWKKWIFRQSLRMPFLPTGSCSDRRGSNCATNRERRSCRPLAVTRSG